MNFSYMKKVSKVLSLILVLILMSTLFAGCWKKDTTPEDTSGPGLNLNLSDTNPSSETQTQPSETVPVTNENMATVISQLNVRTSPSMDASVCGTLYAGDRVEITMRETVVGHEWGRITSPVTGWIVMEFVEMDNASGSTGSNTDTPEETTAATTPASSGSDNVSIQGVITANGLNIRSEASSDGKIQGAYNKGDVVTILETKNGWGRTSKGWIKMDYVDTTGSTASSNTGSNTTTNNNNTTTNNNSGITSNGSTTVQLRGIVIAKELNIRASASQDSERLGSYVYGNRVEIYEKSGSWGRTNKGWISLNYVYQDGTTGTNTAKGTVTAAGGLNIRSGPGTGYASVGSYAEGDTVNILEQFTYDGVTWGCTSKGWISMKYVDVDGSNNTTSGGTDTSTDDDEVTGTITANGGLRIRSGPGSDYGVVGALDYGDRVTIQRRETVDGTTWGRIDEGWISMDYVKLD